MNKASLKTVLLIDDNEHDNFIHTYTINKVKPELDVRAVLSGEEAIEYFIKAKKGEDNYPYPDLVFLDINMPGMNGFEFLEEARKFKYVTNGHPVMVVMLTSSLSAHDVNRATKDFAQEITDYKNKPLTAEMFEEVVEIHFKS